MTDVVIIGAGAAGLMAGIYAQENGAQSLILERNEKAGKKIYITGKGRCNLTNDCDAEDFLKEVPRNPRFLYSALSLLSPRTLMQRMEDWGCPVVVQRGRRVFPATEKASDVTRTLLRRYEQLGGHLQYNTRVRALCVEDGHITGVETDRGQVRTSRVILCSGGLAYPSTGSTGDGLNLARDLGHTISPLRPSLSALETRETWPRQLMGLSLKNVELSMKQGRKMLYDRQGEMLFTHFGISGPLVLELSAHMPDDAFLPVSLNLKPALDEKTLDQRVLDELSQRPAQSLEHALYTLLPHSLADLFPGICGLEERRVCSSISRAERQTLVHTLQNLTLTPTRYRPFEEAIVTRGGVSVREVSPATMESRLIHGLFFAGEILDVDAHTGGYNLHTAFSTGALAGASAARHSED